MLLKQRLHKPRSVAASLLALISKHAAEAAATSTSIGSRQFTGIDLKKIAAEAAATQTSVGSRHIACLLS